MDYFGMLGDAWRTARRRPLLGMSAVSTASSGAVALVFGVSAAALVALFAGTAALTATSGDPVAQARIAEQIVAATSAVSGSAPLVFVLSVAIGIVLVVLLVADVAAQGGLVTEVDAVRRGEPASLGRGMRFGMARWWRIAALVALVALPALVMGLLYSIVLFNFTRTADDAESLAVGVAYLQMLSPLSSIVNLISIPLSVLATLALRFALIDDLEWRPALAAGWRHLFGHFVEVLAVWAVLLLVGMVAGAVLGVGLGVGVAAAAVAVAVSVAAGGSPLVALGLGLGALVLVGVAFVAQMLIVSLSSAMWTIYWRTSTGREDAWLKPEATGGADEAPATEGVE